MGNDSKVKSEDRRRFEGIDDRSWTFDRLVRRLSGSIRRKKESFKAAVTVL